MKRVSVIIILFIGLSAILYTYLNKKSVNANSLFETYYSLPESGMFIVRGENQEGTIQKGLSSYEHKEYEQAIQHFNSALESDPENYMIQYYLASCYLHKSYIKESIELYKNIILQGDNFYVQDARWYIALAYLKQGNLKESKTHLIKLNEADSNFKSEAEQLLTKLNGINI